jgi:hypothetical protein
MDKDEHKGAVEVSVIFHEGQRMFAVPKQPAPVPLTDEQINELRQQYGVTSDGRGIKEFTYVVDFARAIEAAHGITKGQPATCAWTKSADPRMPDTFDATCGVVWTFTDGGPAENDVRFCPGCGASVSVADPEPEEDLYDLAVKADNGGQP